MYSSDPTADERYHMLQLLVENARDYALFTMNSEGVIRSWNIGAERITGYTEAEAIGQSVAILFTPEDRERGVPEVERNTALYAGRAEDERWHMRKNGQRFFASGIMMSLRNEAGQIEGLAKIMRDISDRKQDEARMQSLIQEAGVLQERNRLAGELHDTLAQMFTAIRLQLDALEHILETRPSEAQNYLIRARQMAQDGFQEARNAIRALRVSALEEGLAIAMPRLADQVPITTGTRVTCTLSGNVAPLPPTVESELYRIAQEALTNALRHARSSEINITLHYAPTGVELRITDNGQGFDITVQAMGFGIQGMRERAERIGAAFAMSSEPGRGTQFLITLPLWAFAVSE